MHIKQVVEGPDGNYEFSAVLTPEQHAFLIEFAIKELIRAGLIPFASVGTAAERASIQIPEQKTDQPN